MDEEQVVRLDSGEGSSQGYRSASYIPKQVIHEGRNQEMKHLRRLVRELELEVWGRRRRGNHDESPDDSDYTGESRKESSHQSSFCRSRERSSKIIERHPNSPNGYGRHSAVMDAINQALRRATQSPFSDKFELT